MPQYRNAVFRSKLTQVDVIVDFGKKSIDQYLMNNPFPNSSICFTGDGEGSNSCRHVATDIEPPGDCSVSATTCAIGDNLWLHRVMCYNGDNCSILLGLRFIHHTSNTVPSFSIRRDKDSDIWYLYGIGNSLGSYTKEVCRWAKDRNYPGSSSMVSKCASYGVTLSEYQD